MRARRNVSPDTRPLRVTQIRSRIGFDRKQELALKGLGLRRIGHTVQLVDTPATRGLILKVRHLVTVEESERGQG